MVSQTCDLRAGIHNLRGNVNLVGIVVVGNVFSGSLVLAIYLADFAIAAVSQVILPFMEGRIDWLSCGIDD
jgi:hypothetical protein